MDSSRVINTYAADGTKLRSVYRTNAAALLFPVGRLCGQEHTACLDRVVDYRGQVRYEKDGERRETLVFNPEGYYSASGSAFFAFQRDYQGNVARVWKVSDGDRFLAEPVLAQRNEYFADGTPAPHQTGAGLQPFKYNGNERIRSGGLDAYDFNARLYHPAAAQFSSQDPLAENYYATSPYAFCGGNPVRYSDPTGEGPTDDKYVRDAIAESEYINGSYKIVDGEYGPDVNVYDSGGKLYMTCKATEENQHNAVYNFLSYLDNDLFGEGTAHAGNTTNYTTQQDVTVATAATGIILAIPVLLESVPAAAAVSATREIQATSSAAGFVSKATTYAGLLNAVDDVFTNPQGESFVQQHLESDRGKTAVQGVKTTINITNTVYDCFSPNIIKVADALNNIVNCINSLFNGR